MLSGSIVGWGSEVEDAFDLIVFLYVETGARLDRLRRRETERFGRVDPALLTWASEYDTVPRNERSLAVHRDWLARRTARVIELPGVLPVEALVSRILDERRRSGRRCAPRPPSRSRHGAPPR